MLTYDLLTILNAFLILHTCEMYNNIMGMLLRFENY